MRVTVDKRELIAKLRTNRENHANLVAEARITYVKEAEKQLRSKLDDLGSGKLAALSFSLKVPQNFTTIYDTVIGMLERHTEPNIEMSGDEYRQLVEDEWSWTSEWVQTNSRYSTGTRAYGAGKGIDVE